MNMLVSFFRFVQFSPENINKDIKGMQVSFSLVVQVEAEHVVDH